MDYSIETECVQWKALFLRVCLLTQAFRKDAHDFRYSLKIFPML